MGRKAVRKSARYEPEAGQDRIVLDWDPRAYYERGLVQADEMYRKYRYQVAPDAEYPDAEAEAMAVKVHATVAKMKRQYVIYLEAVDALLDVWATATGYRAVYGDPTPAKDIEDYQLSPPMKFGWASKDEAVTKLMKTIEEGGARLVGLSVQINYMFGMFAESVDLEKPKSTKKKKDV